MNQKNVMVNAFTSAYECSSCLTPNTLVFDGNITGGVSAGVVDANGKLTSRYSTYRQGGLAVLEPIDRSGRQDSTWIKNACSKQAFCIENNPHATCRQAGGAGIAQGAGSS
ncbi:MAG: hypothetical protein IPO35_00925 [Uliginosibacterium sp.]|nr:hypothetical protein [Uliginosibacterium sp.]